MKYSEKKEIKERCDNYKREWGKVERKEIVYIVNPMFKEINGGIVGLNEYFHKNRVPNNWRW